MKLKELATVVFEKVIIYKEVGEEFIDIYNGDISKIPTNILEMDVASVGSSRKNVLDIKIKQDK